MLDQRRRRWPNNKTALGECPFGVVSSLLIWLNYSAESICTVLYAEGSQTGFTCDLRMRV